MVGMNESTPNMPGAETEKVRLRASDALESGDIAASECAGARLR